LCPIPVLTGGLQICNVPLFLGRGAQVMDEKNAEWYRAQAAECSALAEKATDPRIKAFNQAEADRWLRLAELAEKKKP
jgi:hypothetical protein